MYFLKFHIVISEFSYIGSVTSHSVLVLAVLSTLHSSTNVYTTSILDETKSIANNYRI